MINKIKTLQEQLKQLWVVFIGLLKTSLSKAFSIPSNQSRGDTAEILNQIYSIYTTFCNADQDKLDKIGQKK